MKVAMTVRKRVMIFAVMFVASVRQAKMTAVTISFNWRSSCSCRVRIALNLKGLDYEYTGVNLVKGEQNSPEFRKLNPLGYVPVLVDGDVLLSDSFAILLYLAEKYPQHPLLPSDLKTKAINFQVNFYFLSL
ncbi:hypothetical protein Pint_11411 [Pistacia integerrima]|uniref:Uncharacterized protein n=2 Tax=Pistacia TaxID=55512 RepID=A0ACC0XE87_9ROSI|nr:hypothetical protein Pint_11411 [Pistacia integerrima]